MDSETEFMDVSVEYDSEKIDTASKGDKYTYLIDNIDFGIVERAKQKVDITKNVTWIKVTLANGQVIVDATEEYYKYGTIPRTEEEKDRTIVKMNPSVYDYLDSEISLVDTEAQNKAEWKEVVKNDYNERIINYETIVTNSPIKETGTERYYKEIKENGHMIWEYGETTYSELFTQWEIKLQKLKTAIIRKAKLENRNIFNTAKLE